MITLHKVNVDWISGIMFGIEFLFEDDMEDDDPNVKFKFGFAVDLGIVRLLFQKYELTKPE